MLGGLPTTRPTGKTRKSSGRRGSWKRSLRLRPMAMTSGTFPLVLEEEAALELFLHCQFLVLLWDVWYRILSSCLLQDSQRLIPQRKVGNSVCTFWSILPLLQSPEYFKFQPVTSFLVYWMLKNAELLECWIELNYVWKNNICGMSTV